MPWHARPIIAEERQLVRSRFPRPPFSLGTTMSPFPTPTASSLTKSHFPVAAPRRAGVSPRSEIAFAFPLDARWYGRAVCAFLVVPNLVMAVVSYFTIGDWHPLNLDYVLVGSAIGVFGVPTLAAGVAVLFLLDVALTLAPVFHFDGATFSQGLLELLMARPGVSIALALPVFALAILFSGSLFKLANAPRRHYWISRAFLLGTGASLLVLDSLNGTNQFIHLEGTRLSLNLAGSGLYHAAVNVRDARREAAERSRAGGVLPAASGATSRLLLEVAQDTGGRDNARNVSLVLVESMGLFQDDRAAALLLGPLTGPDIAARYIIRTGSVPFNGPTTAGEFRELCGLQATYLLAPRSPLHTCLPERLRARGYRTVALHGFRSTFFNRRAWYPVIGFDHMIFEQDAADPTAAKCGAIFRGPCDEDVARRYRQELLGGAPTDRRFVYWLTLSSHFPVDHSAARPDAFDCGRLPEIGQDPTVCDLVRIWSTTLAAIRDVALDPRLPRTRFVIVGDHSPPFLEGGRRDLFSDSAVPFVELLPKADMQP